MLKSFSETKPRELDITKFSKPTIFIYLIKKNTHMKKINIRNRKDKDRYDEIVFLKLKVFNCPNNLSEVIIPKIMNVIESEVNRKIFITISLSSTS
tara:strand:- start:874 stop:1161 length:288 start_codon:yes stop_codon:yes gene_type:complete